jgi:hypothetical protein
MASDSLTPEKVRQRLSEAREQAPNLTVWINLNPNFHPEGLGFLPDILLSADPRSVKDQLDDRYRHGGGYRDSGFTKFKLGKGMALKWPEDPPQHPLAATLINDELVVFYPHALLLVMQLDGTWKVTRVD